MDILNKTIDLKFSWIMALEMGVVFFWLLDIILRQIVMGKEACKSWY
jgi:hypothetical protein